MRIEYGNSKKIVDYIFWIILILFTNPGGILEAFGEDSRDGGINVTDFLFFVLGMCFVIVFNLKYYRSDQYFLKISKVLLIFLIYYVVVFTFFIPQFKNSPNYSFLYSLIKIRFGIMNFFLVQFIYLFYLRSYKLFFTMFLSSSIVVLSLFIFSVLTGIEILPLKTLDRRFVSIDRIFLHSYGLMPFLMAMGSVVLVFKFKIRQKGLILIGFLLMFLTWVLSLLRREIFGVVILFLVASVVSNYLHGKKLIPIKKMFLIFFQIILLLFVVKFSFPKYLEAVESSVQQTIHVFKYGETLTGQKDVRLGFGKKELQEKIKNNFIVGTGFDNNWRVSEEAGFEASDYPFLAAIAINGILGMVIFLPLYVILYKTVFRGLKHLRKNPVSLISFEQYVLIVFIVYYIFEILNYTYWFLPVSLFAHGAHHKWYIYLAMYFAARKVFFISNNFKNKIVTT